MEKSTLFFEHLAKKIGLTLSISMPNQNAKKICAITNGCVGVALITTAVISNKATLFVLGSIATAGAFLLVKNK